jgi:hypothetical protein
MAHAYEATGDLSHCTTMKRKHYSSFVRNLYLMGWLPDIINDHFSDSQAPTIPSQVYKVNSLGMQTYVVLRP